MENDQTKPKQMQDDSIDEVPMPNTIVEGEPDAKEFIQIESRYGDKIIVGSHTLTVDSLCGYAKWIKDNILNDSNKKNGGTYIG